LRSKPKEAKFTAQPEPMLANPQNLRAKEVSQTGYAVLICSTKISHKNFIYHWPYKDGISKEQDGKRRWSGQMGCPGTKADDIQGI